MLLPWIWLYGNSFSISPFLYFHSSCSQTEWNNEHIKMSPEFSEMPTSRSLWLPDCQGQLNLFESVLLIWWMMMGGRKPGNLAGALSCCCRSLTAYHCIFPFYELLKLMLISSHLKKEKQTNKTDEGNQFCPASFHGFWLFARKIISLSNLSLSCCCCYLKL